MTGTNGFLIEAENDQFCVVGRVIVITFNLKHSRCCRRRRSVDYDVKKLHVLQLKSVFPHAANFGSDT